MGSSRVSSNLTGVAYARYFFVRWVTQSNAWMAERSKAADLSSVIYGCVGSNPTSGILFIFLSRGATGKKKKIYPLLHSVGFEPTHPKILRPERSALDRSAKSALIDISYIILTSCIQTVV